MKKGIFASLALLVSMGQLNAQQPVVMMNDQCCAPQVCCDAAPSCGPKCWFSADYLVWWIRENQANTPLVVRGDGVDPATSGVIGQDSTQIILSGSDIDHNAFSGIQLTLGGWLNANRTIGAELSGFMLERKTFTFAGVSDATGTPQVAIPYNDLNPVSGTGESYVDTAFPAFVAGRLDITESVRLWGLESNIFANLMQGDSGSVDVFVGFRYLDLLEKYSQTENYAVIPGAVDTASFQGAASDGPFTVQDIFQTRNQFYGGQIGARANLELGRAFVGVTGKVAIGTTHNTLNIHGQTTSTDPGNSGTAPGGVFAVSSNIGHHDDNSFSVVPEIDLKLGFKVSERLTAYIGYSVFWWTEVARPVSQIDRNVNGGLQPTYALAGFGQGPAVPVASINTDTFWTQGLNFGVQFRY